MRVLITGNLGFVGRQTEKYFIDKGLEVVGFDLMLGNDIRNIERIRQAVRETKPDRILHLAAIARFAEADEDPQLAFETNSLGTMNVARVSGEFGIPMVYASTGSVYMPIIENPPITEKFPAKGNSVYACAKYLGELYVKQYSSTYIILRYSHLYGKDKRYHGLIGGFLDRMNRALTPTLYGGKQSNDFMYINDVARANYLAVTASPDNWRQIYNVGTGHELTAEEAGKIICDKYGYRGEIEIKQGRTVDPERFVFDCTKAERMLGFKAEYTFEKGLEEMFADLKLDNKPVESSLPELKDKIVNKT